MHLVRLGSISCLSVLLLSGCLNDSKDTSVASSSSSSSVVSTVTFSGISAVDSVFPQTAYPLTLAAQTLPLTSDQRAIISTKSINAYGITSNIDFVSIMKTGDIDPAGGGAVWGQAINYLGDPLPSYTGASVTLNSKKVSYSVDHSTLIPYETKLFSISQFEESAGFMYITELNQDKVTGKLTAVATKPIDLSSIYGGFTFCAGMPTPWNTHLGGEEYPVDAKFFDANTYSVSNTAAVSQGATSTNPVLNVNSTFDKYLEYWDISSASPATILANRDARLANSSIYRAGYPVEVEVVGSSLGTAKTAANTHATKHYAMGRMAWELAYVMPDNKTVYAGIDGANQGYFKFVASNAQDLSAGRLSVAKLTQTSSTGGGEFAITWLDMGYATNAEIDSYISKGITFSDMFDYAAPDASYNCPVGYSPVEANFSYSSTKKPAEVGECVKLKTTSTLDDSSTMTAAMIKKAASRLEPLRYAATLGATLEFNKFEGVTFDSKRNKLYVAISAISKGMSNPALIKDSTGAKASDHIQITENLCGGVYQLSVDSSYTTTTMSSLTLGAYKTYSNGQQCDLDKVAMPDNVAMGPTRDILLIAQDSDWESSVKSHQNDVLWAYSLTDGVLTRLLSSPVGAEVTSPWYYHNLNGWDYLTVVVQHPYGEGLDSTQLLGFTTEEDKNLAKRATFGYIGPIRTFNEK